MTAALAASLEHWRMILGLASFALNRYALVLDDLWLWRLRCSISGTQKTNLLAVIVENVMSVLYGLLLAAGSNDNSD